MQAYCEQCGHKAKVRAYWRAFSCQAPGGTLDFCNHHYLENNLSLTLQGFISVRIEDANDKGLQQTQLRTVYTDQEAAQEVRA